jgi:hypothetical protein
MESMSDQLRSGIEAAKSGENQTARRLLQEVIESDPSSKNAEYAWMWMSAIEEYPSQKRKCLENVLSINPDNDIAKRGLQKIPVEVEPEVSLPTVEEITRPQITPDPIYMIAPLAPDKSRKKKSGSSIKNVITFLLIILGVCIIGSMLLSIIAGLGAGNGSSGSSSSSSTKRQLPPTNTPNPRIAKAAWNTVDIRELVKNPDRHKGSQVHYTGEIFRIEEDRGTSALQVWVEIPGGSEWDREAIIIIWEGGTTGIYDGTTIEVWGYAGGSLEGKNAFGATISQPMIEAEYLTYFR